MHASILLEGQVSRRTTLALLAGALLSRPAPVLAQDDNGIAWVSGNGGIRGHLQFGPDGTVRIQSIIRHRDATGEIILVAEPDSAAVTFADANENGTVGLTSVQFMARNPMTGERISITLATTGGEVIDRNGSYLVVLRIGETETTVPVDVRVLPTRTRARRRKR